MAYIKTSWVARVGTALNRFLKTNEDSPSGTVELTNDPTGVTTAGTPFTVANMNKIEEGIYDAHYPEFTEAATLTNIASGEVGTTLWGKVKKAISAVIAHDGYLNQGVKTTDSPTFATVNTTGNTSVGGDLGVTGALSGASINTGGLGAFLIGQNLRTTDNVSFANINPPVDNNDASMPSVGIGGFSYAVGSTSTSGAYPSITIGSGGTWVYIANSTTGLGIKTTVGRISGGSSVQGQHQSDNDTAYVYVIAWRIA